MLSNIVFIYRKGLRWRDAPSAYDRTSGMNTKLHAVPDASGRPLSFSMTTGQASDYTGAAALLDDLPKAQWLLGNCRYEPVRSEPLSGPKACSPGQRSRNEPVEYDKGHYHINR